MKRKFFYSFVLIILILISAMLYSIDFSYITSLPNSFYLSTEEIAKEKENTKGFLSLDIGEETLTSNLSSKERIVTYKLFGFIPIKKIVAKILPEEYVYVGGNAIGISLKLNQCLVVSKSLGKDINENTLKEGDLIYKINGKEVNSLEEISSEIENSNGEVQVEYFHKNDLKSSKLVTYKDYNGEQKIGFTIKDDIKGIGTLTYINSETGKFGALGHEICDNVNQIEIIDGGIYDCKMLGIEKGEINKPGQLKCVFIENQNKQGEVNINSPFGVYGKINDMSLIDKNLSVKLGGRLSVKPGNAKIVSSVSGIREEYDIEIIRVYNQNCEKDKSFVFRVIDDRLINLTGGIVQGMSGSPILQNGKMIGAVTHVFTSDPTKGYGVYSDWLIENNP